MKTFAPLLITFLFLVGVSSCAECPDCPECPPKGYALVPIDQGGGQNPDTIAKAKAVELTSEWRTTVAASGGFLRNTPVYAFSIPHQDIAGTIKSDSARAYLGMEPTTGEYKLIFVGVDSTGKDDLSSIYDLTIPCPTACDTSSVLYTGN